MFPANSYKRWLPVAVQVALHDAEAVLANARSAIAEISDAAQRAEAQRQLREHVALLREHASIDIFALQQQQGAMQWVTRTCTKRVQIIDEKGRVTAKFVKVEERVAKRVQRRGVIVPASAFCPGAAAAADTVSSQLQAVDGVDDVAAADAAPRTVKRKPRGKSTARRKQRYDDDDDDDDHIDCNDDADDDEYRPQQRLPHQHALVDPRGQAANARKRLSTAAENLH